MIIVTTLEEVEEAERKGHVFVRAKCPKCGGLWTSLIPNAKNVVTKGCIICADEEDSWNPVVGVIKHYTKYSDSD